MKDFLKWALKRLAEEGAIGAVILLSIFCAVVIGIVLLAYLLATGHFALVMLIFPGLPFAIVWAAYIYRDTE